MNLVEEFQEKLDRVRGLLQREALAGLLFKRQANLSWIACGGADNVSMASDVANAGLLVTPSRAILIASNIEIQRVLEEEVKGIRSEIEVESYAWNQRSDFEVANAIMQNKKWGSDVACRSARSVTNQVTAIRTPLLPSEIARYQAIGKDVGEALYEVARALKPGLTESEAAGRLAHAFLARGIAPAVILVAADDRINKYRHPIPKMGKARKRLLLVANVRRQGLYAAATRQVCFGKPAPAIAKRHAACCRIEAAAMAVSRPGAPMGKALQTMIAAYAAEGFADEWREHHQGGPIGYDGRDLILTAPGLKASIVEGQAFAFNPSIAGAKSEDTFIVKAKGIEILTESEKWPSIGCETDDGVIKRPDLLVL